MSPLRSPGMYCFPGHQAILSRLYGMAKVLFDGRLLAIELKVSIKDHRQFLIDLFSSAVAWSSAKCPSRRFCNRWRSDAGNHAGKGAAAMAKAVDALGRANCQVWS